MYFQSQKSKSKCWVEPGDFLAQENYVRSTARLHALLLCLPLHHHDLEGKERSWTDYKDLDSELGYNS